MFRIRLPLAALALSVLAACQTVAPTAPVDSPEPTSTAVIDSDTTAETVREGNLFGSGN